MTVDLAKITAEEINELSYPYGTKLLAEDIRKLASARTLAEARAADTQRRVDEFIELYKGCGAPPDADAPAGRLSWILTVMHGVNLQREERLAAIEAKTRERCAKVADEQAEEWRRLKDECSDSKAIAACSYRIQACEGVSHGLRALKPEGE